MNSTYALQPLKPSNIPHLLQVLKKLLPDSAMAYNWILNHVNWAKKRPELQSLFLCPDGDWTHGTVVSLVDGLAVPNKTYGIVYAQEKGLQVLKKGLMKTKLIEWDRLKEFSGVPERCVPLVSDVMKSKNSNFSDDCIIPCHMIYMAQEEAENYPLPKLDEGVRVGQLDASHLDMVCDNWRHYEPEYRPMVLKMLELNPSTGVFVKTGRGEEELATMVVQTEYGGVGLMQTVPGHRRKGYAKIALAHQTRALGQIGVMPHGHIMSSNKSSSSLAEKCGYKVHGVTAWLSMAKLRGSKISPANEID